MTVAEAKEFEAFSKHFTYDMPVEDARRFLNCLIEETEAGAMRDVLSSMDDKELRSFVHLLHRYGGRSPRRITDPPPFLAALYERGMLQAQSYQGWLLGEGRISK
jgi:hypothetical protein